MVRDLDRATSKICSSYGITYPQFQVMEALLHKGSLTVGEIRDSILSSNGTVPVIINNLEKIEMVRRTKDPSDNRKCIVEITAEGKSLIEQVWAEPRKANTVLGWKADTPIADVLRSAWNWEKKIRKI